jgi:enamine deaminase RidA (YjgF/YER057c/UK114 family)
VNAGDHIFVLGQAGCTDPNEGKGIEGIKAQTKQCLDNMKHVLEGMGSSCMMAVRVPIFLRKGMILPRWIKHTRVTPLRARVLA